MKTRCWITIGLAFICIAAGGQRARIMFYNTENLFDVTDDTLVNDNEFLPDSSRHWTYDRYWRKVVRIYQVMSAIDGWDMPAITGFCEVENRAVLEDLVYRTPLAKYDYRIVHQDSPDPRGIDGALIYRKDIFEPDTIEWIPVQVKGGGPTRDILKVTGRLWDKAKLTVYVNHWPSRSGGTLASAPRRLAAATVLKADVRAMLTADPEANIILMGDFNDEPGDASLQFLCAPESACQFAIVNLSETVERANASGTIKYGGTWSTFDQILVSSPVLTGKNGLMAESGRTEIFSAPFLLEPDLSFSGYRPCRTYLGPNYHNGFSDHLPVSISITVK